MLASFTQNPDPDEREDSTDENRQPGEGEEQNREGKQNNVLRWALNSIIIILLPLIGFAAYLYFSPKAVPTQPVVATRPPVEGQPAGTTPPQKPVKTVQIDVLNGCGAKGAGIKMTNLLRSSGFDVVEMKNYKTFHVPQTLVVDRMGDLRAARQVASALGVNEKNIIQQLNPDYYVDVSVIIGKDYQTFLPAK